MQRGDHFIFEPPPFTFCWNETRVRKFISEPSVFRVHGPIRRWWLLSGESGKSGFVRERSSWLTIHPDLAEALEKWCESASGGGPGRLVHVEAGLTSVRFLVKLIEPILEIIREDFRVSEELSDVVAFSFWNVIARGLLGFVDVVRGEVLESERVKQARFRPFHRPR